MKITQLTVTDEHGVQHVWEGEGFVHPISSQSYKTEDYSLSVTAHLVLPSQGRVSA